MQKATYRQAQHVLKIVGQRNLTSKQLQQLLVSGLFTDILEAASTDGFTTLNRDTVRVALGLPKLTPDPVITELGELIVSERSTLKEMVRAGEYDYSHDCITDLFFHITSRGSRKLYLVHFKKEMDTKEVEAAVAQMDDKELAKVEDLLAVGVHSKHKELQREFPIICLGSYYMSFGTRTFSCLDRRSCGRSLELTHLIEDEDGKWDGGDRFLLVGK